MIDAECSVSLLFARVHPPRGFSLSAFFLPPPFSPRSNRWSNPDFLLIAARGTRACKMLRLRSNVLYPDELYVLYVSIEMKRHRRHIEIISPSSIAVPHAGHNFSTSLYHYVKHTHTNIRLFLSRGSCIARDISFRSCPTRPISKYFAEILMYFSSLSILLSPASHFPDSTIIHPILSVAFLRYAAVKFSDVLCVEWKIRKLFRRTESAINSSIIIVRFANLIKTHLYDKIIFYKIINNK